MFFSDISIVVLGVFTWLVANHHTKLYAPRDFPDAETFLQTLSPDEQRRRIDSEVDEILSNSPTSSEFIDTPRSSLAEKIVLVEELALRELETEFSTPIHRQITFNQAGRDFGIDGMFVKSGEAFGIEIKYVSGEILPETSFDQVKRTLEYASHHYEWKRFNMILVAVYENLDEDRLIRERQRLDVQLSSISKSMFFRAYDLQLLQMKYGLNEG